jgi:glycosyltransferase involved in cell wall biosynthesis
MTGLKSTKRQNEGLSNLPAGFPPPPQGRTGWPWTEGCTAAGQPAEVSMWPRVTIVTPSYNQGRFLEEAMRSVLLQGYPNLEYIVMDAGSSDGSVEVIRKYEPYLTHWTSERDKGQSDAINRGWRIGTGEIVAWVNADDLYEPGVAFEAVRYLQEHPRAGMVCGSVRIVQARDSRQVLREEIARPRSLAAALNSGAPPGTTAAFVRRQALEEVGYLDVRLHYWIDPELWIRIGLKWNLGHIAKPWYRFRAHAESKTRCAIGRFAEETVTSLWKLYGRGDLPQAIRRTQPNAMSLAYLRLAGAYTNAGDRALAKQSYLKALWSYPLNSLRQCIKREFLRGLGEYFFGKYRPWRLAVRLWRQQNSGTL